MRKRWFGLMPAALTAAAPLAAAEYGTAQEAETLLDKVVAAMKTDEEKGRKGGFGVGVEGGNLVPASGPLEHLYCGLAALKSGFVVGAVSHSMVLALNTEFGPVVRIGFSA